MTTKIVREEKTMTTRDDVEVHETREGHLIVRSRSTGLSVVGSWIEIRNTGRAKVEEECRRMLARAVDSLVHPFEVTHRCHECGGAMHRPVSLWRCKSGDPTHTATGPEIADELRARMSKVE